MWLTELAELPSTFLAASSNASADNTSNACWTQLDDFHHCWETVEPHNYFQAIGGAFAAVATWRSTRQICRHLSYNKGKMKPLTIRILAVVPIYAIDSWACLVLNSSRGNWVVLLSFFREAYEAVAMCAFMQYVLTYLGGPTKLARKLHLLRDGPFVKHVEVKGIGMKLIRREYMAGADFVSQVIIGVLQYVVVTVFLFVVNFIIWRYPVDQDSIQELGLQHVNTTQFAGMIPGAVKALSCAYSLYHLILLYKETYKLLAPLKPVFKFLAIKGIIFFTFYQGIMCGLAVRLHMIPSYTPRGPGVVWTEDEISDGIKSFLLCIEMLFFAEIHRYAYPYDEWKTLEKQQAKIVGNAPNPSQQTAILSKDATEASAEKLLVEFMQAGKFQDVYALFGQIKELRISAEKERQNRANEIMGQRLLQESTSGAFPLFNQPAANPRRVISGTGTGRRQIP